MCKDFQVLRDYKLTVAKDDTSHFLNCPENPREHRENRKLELFRTRVLFVLFFQASRKRSERSKVIDGD